MLSASKSGSGLSTGYNLTRSLRFRSSATAYLSRTPASTTNQQVWTWSSWVKRGALAAYGTVLNGYNSGGNQAAILFWVDDTLSFNVTIASTNYALNTTQVFRDPSAWYHIVYAVDTTQATAANRVKLYVNGTQVTAFSGSYPPQNSNLFVNSTNVQNIGRNAGGGNNFDGYFAEVNLIDGQALTPSSFGSTNAITGVWQPARYTGTYGTNGFYLPFTDNSALTTSSNVGLGKDFSGNGNYWTTNNISITAGVTYDSMTDVPTLTSATAANFAVLNPLDSLSGTASNGNLTWTASTAQSDIRGSIAIPSSGAFYLECVVGTTTGAAVGVSFGLATSSVPLNTSSAATGLYQLYASSLGQLTLNNTTVTSLLGAFNAGDVLQIAVDATNTKMWLGKNNTWYDSSGGTTGNPSTGANPTTTNSMVGLFPFSNCYSEFVNWNMGQRAFSYTPPTGFVALNTYNLPDSTILAGNKVMDATLWTGNGTSQSIVNAGTFKPDFVWIKGRSAATYNILTDSVRGTNSQLFSNDTLAQESRTDRLTAFNSNGFSLGNWNDVNNNAATYVGWQWQAGQGSTSSNTNGTITSTVSVNASAGFSVITFNGTGAAATVGHGLGVAPAFYIAKYRSGSAPNIAGWACYHSALTSAAYRIDLNSDSGQISDTNAFNSTAPTSSVLSIGTNLSVSSTPMVVYAWTPIAGYSSMGSYTGNGSTDGTFVYTGFKPRFVLFKRTDATGYGWVIHDSARNTYNVVNLTLYPSGSDAESTNQAVDFVSNGFKLRDVSGGVNGSGGTYIYAAFATNPFKQSLAF